ncbi:MAG: hypothetical protein JHC61_10915 [Burkholderiaceae bacterium]|nr:hypothetical protein [Burkholderiaceae bacterium]
MIFTKIAVAFGGSLLAIFSLSVSSAQSFSTTCNIATDPINDGDAAVEFIRTVEDDHWFGEELWYVYRDPRDRREYCVTFGNNFGRESRAARAMALGMPVKFSIKDKGLVSGMTVLGEVVPNY